MPAQSLKILFLLPDLRGGGAERVALDLADGFKAVGVRVEFLLMQNTGELLQEAESKFSVHTLNCSRFRSVCFPLSRKIREIQPDVIFVFMWPLTVIAPIARAISGIKSKLVLSEHGILSQRSSSFVSKCILRLSMAFAYRMADNRVGVSQGVVDDMAKLALMTKSRFEKIYNPVREFPELTSAQTEAADSLWANHAGARIVCVGSFKPVKNHDLLIRAFAKLNDSNARLLLLGEGGLRLQLQRLAEELGIADQVHFYGFCENPAPFYATADLLVLSSNHEGFGNVIVEAMSFGVPVVSTDCPTGPREILEGGQYGDLVPVGDVNAMVTAIRKALSKPPQKELLKNRAAMFQLEKVVQQYMKVLSIEV